MPQQFQQVSGGACSLTMYRESSPGKVAAGSKGVQLAFLNESFKKGSSKKQRSVIRNVRGPGKPYAGLPQMSGQLESAAYAPQLGYLLRVLCAAPVTTPEAAHTFDAAAVTELDTGLVGLPCAGHGFVQDAVITIAGTTNYNGVYRVAEGVTADVIAVQAPFVAETLTADAKAYRGRAVWLSGPARDLSAGKVALPVAGGVHALHPGEQVTISGTTNFDGTFTLQDGTENGDLVISKAFMDEDFDGSALAVPVFFRHVFALPRRQPTVCMEKYLDFESGAVTNPYRRFHFCKVNGLSYSFGGDDELKFTLDFAVGREALSPAPIDSAPLIPPAVTFDNIEASVWVAGVRRGDVESGNVTNSFGITAKSAVGDLGQYSRMSEGDPDCKCTLSVFLERDDLQALADAAATVPLSIIICSVSGEQVDFDYPEAELDSEGPAITGKEGLMQDFTVLPFVDRGSEVLRVKLVNRVESYA